MALSIARVALEADSYAVISVVSTPHHHLRRFAKARPRAYMCGGLRKPVRVHIAGLTDRYHMRGLLLLCGLPLGELWCSMYSCIGGVGKYSRS